MTRAPERLPTLAPEQSAQVRHLGRTHGLPRNRAKLVAELHFGGGKR